ncbi:hypothetical protein H4219_003102 [Mycoemilia scoparia]|uniref:Major facilitator superfamily (MFS) profile domain-containing protein n=1 Tax=Mycoemilia scoparia TaxID=417184 RepID=A0A9W8DNB4_9FUNG|nr:hypothetical protein H4219_003102 [Mycoemilia scoparia]
MTRSPSPTPSLQEQQHVGSQETSTQTNGGVHYTDSDDNATPPPYLLSRTTTFNHNTTNYNTGYNYSDAEQTSSFIPSFNNIENLRSSQKSSRTSLTHHHNGNDEKSDMVIPNSELGGGADHSTTSPAADPTAKKGEQTGSFDAEKHPNKAINTSTTENSQTSNEGAKGQEEEIPYSPFSSGRRKLITLTVSLIGILGPLTSSIYYPAIQDIANDLNTTLTMVNSTLTAFMFAMAVFPLFWGPMADIIGRRYVYIITIILYLGGNIGCALTPNIVALIIFRIIQSAGSSAILSIGAGTIADIYPRSQRGTALGAFYVGPLIGPVIGPIIGGYITENLSWRWTFWILTIISGVAVIATFLFLPETHRRMVAEKYNMNLINQPKKLKWRQINPLRTMMYIRYPNVFCVVFYVVMVFGCYYGITSSNSLAFQTIYKMDIGKSGLCYIPLGVGNLVGSILGGRINDIVLRRIRIRLEKKALEDGQPQTEPIVVEPESRLYFVWVGALLFFGCGITYGWLLIIGAPLAAVLVLQFFIGFGMTLQFSATSNYLMDLFPTRGATIIAAQTFYRSIWAGICMLVIPISQENIGWGKTLTIFECTCVLGFMLFLPIVFFGRRIAARFPVNE